MGLLPLLRLVRLLLFMPNPPDMPSLLQSPPMGIPDLVMSRLALTLPLQIIRPRPDILLPHLAISMARTLVIRLKEAILLPRNPAIPHNPAIPRNPAIRLRLDIHLLPDIRPNPTILLREVIRSIPAMGHLARG
jgi:hypothetical protein